jgi:AcrR family transcriptional regulator
MSVAKRAAPMAPEARRASIIAATLPLLRTHGRAVTTAQIAMAAGVAEGTLFRVFPDKDALIDAAIQSAFDAGPTEGELRAIDRAQPLRVKLIAAVDILQRRMDRVWQLIAAVALPVPPPQRPKQGPAPMHDPGIGCALEELLEPHRDELRCAPDYATRLLRALTLAASHPRIMEGPLLTPGEIVTVILDGLRPRGDDDLEQEAG